MGIYEPMTHYLLRTRADHVRLTFKEIEAIIDRALPGSAYRHREWWANNPTGHSHARSWASAGWRTEQVDLEKRVLVFSRVAHANGKNESEKVRDPFGALRGSVTYASGTDLTEPTGEEWAAERDAEHS